METGLLGMGLPQDKSSGKMENTDRAGACEQKEAGHGRYSSQERRGKEQNAMVI